MIRMFNWLRVGEEDEDWGTTLSMTWAVVVSTGTLLEEGAVVGSEDEGGSVEEMTAEVRGDELAMELELEGELEEEEAVGTVQAGPL